MMAADGDVLAPPHDKSDVRPMMLWVEEGGVTVYSRTPCGLGEVGYPGELPSWTALVPSSAPAFPSPCRDKKEHGGTPIEWPAPSALFSSLRGEADVGWDRGLAPVWPVESGEVGRGESRGCLAADMDDAFWPLGPIPDRSPGLAAPVFADSTWR